MILVDGDILLYRACYACQKNKYYLGIDNHRVTESLCSQREATFINNNMFDGQAVREQECIIKDIQHVMNYIDDSMFVITDDLQPDYKDYQIYLSAIHTFREMLCPEYKAHRRNRKKPYHFQDAKYYLINQYNAFIMDSLEADDAMGIHQTKETIIATIDKDLNMIPGEHYNIISRQRYSVSEKQAFKSFCLQMLIGDPVDNVRGIASIGVKKANALLDDIKDEREMWDIVVSLYKGYYREDFVGFITKNAELLWIQRKDYKCYRDYIYGYLKEGDT